MAGPLSSSVGRLMAPFLPTATRTALLALICTAALELARIIADGHAPWFGKMVFFPLLFLLDVAVTWLVIGLLHALVGSFPVTAALSAMPPHSSPVVDHEKARVLREPLYPGDLELVHEVGFMADMVGPRLVPLLSLVAVLAAVIVVAASQADRR